MNKHKKRSYYYKALQKDFDNFLEQKWLSIVLANYQSRDKLVQERRTSCIMICIYNKKEQRPRDHWYPDLPGALECTEHSCSRTAPHANFETTNYKQRTKTNLSPTGVKNYMLAEFLFSFFFPSLFLSYSFLEIKHTRLPPHRHRTVQNLLPFFFSNETQA